MKKVFFILWPRIFKLNHFPRQFTAWQVPHLFLDVLFGAYSASPALFPPPLLFQSSDLIFSIRSCLV